MYNPLFLSTAVDFVKAKSETSFPRGLDSIGSIITFWFEAVEQGLIDRGYDRITPGDGKLPEIVRKLATQMAIAGEEYIPYEFAHQTCEDSLGLGPPTKASDRLLPRLIDEGVLLDTPSFKTGGEKLVSFGFQKFSDYFIADAILRDCASVEILAQSLKKGGKYDRFFGKDNPYQYAGPRIALMALTPGRLGCELPNLEPGIPNNLAIFIGEFVSSISWRQSDAITAETVKLLEKLRERREDGVSPISNEEWYGLLVEMATISKCLINAKYLKRQLASLPLGQRDASWSLYLTGKMRDDAEDDDWPPVYQLINWSWMAPASTIDLNKIHLVATTLALMRSTMDRGLRDCASKGLSSLLQKYPHEIAPLITEFADWDDSYVRERVLAAAAAGVLFTREQKILTAAALAADGMVFSKEPVERHAWTRRYAQIIVDHAAANHAVYDDTLIARSMAPYASKPILDWPTWEQTASKYDEAGDIFSSVIGYPGDNGKHPAMAGDFGRYTMGGIGNSFSSDIRGPAVPSTRERTIELLWDEIRALGTEQSDALDIMLTVEQAASDASLVSSGQFQMRQRAQRLTKKQHPPILRRFAGKQKQS